MIIKHIKKAVGKLFNTKEHQKTDGHERSPEWHKYRNDWLDSHPACFCGYNNRKYLNVHHLLPFHLEFTGKQVREMGVKLGREFTDEEIITGRELELNVTNYVTICEPPGPDGHHCSIGHSGNYKNFNPNIKKDIQEYLLKNKK